MDCQTNAAGWCDDDCMENLIQKIKTNFVDADGLVHVATINEMCPVPHVQNSDDSDRYWFYGQAFGQATGQSFSSLSGYQQVTVVIVLGYC
jgi:hypothetical protein